MSVVSHALRHVGNTIIATKRQQKRTPLESTRVGAEEDSSADIGPETTLSKSIMQESATAIVTATAATAGHKLQICACGWRKVTSQLGLRIHQGKKRCLREERQRPCIDYFLRKGSNQLNEAQQPDANHSLQCISTTVMEQVNSSTVQHPTSQTCSREENSRAQTACKVAQCQGQEAMGIDHY